ncbi:MAG: hypothetical protein IJW39_02105 [Opitutales bacterium]|nr:hypothetical protein [Opitutales bacterium]
MDQATHVSGLLSVEVADESTKQGTLCVLDSAGKLTPWTEGADDAAALMVTLVDPGERGKLVSAALAGNQPGSVLVNAVAGTYTAGMPVYAATGGAVTAASGTRQVGTIAKTATLADPGMVEVFLVYIPKA